MPAFGENLRREREMRGVSLEEISSATKISLRFLDAIEREDFTKLPGGIFSRSFIRSYARYLGLDEERVVADFQLAAKPQVDFDLHRMPGGGLGGGRPVARTPIIATVVALALLAGGYALYRYAPRPAESVVTPPPAQVPPPQPAAPSTTPPPPNASGDATALPGVNPATGEVTPGSPGTPGAPAAGSASTPTGQPPTTANPATPPNPQTAAPPTPKLGADSDLLLQVAATERAWVAVESDGKTVLQRVLNPDEVQTLKAHNSFDLTTGNAQAVILTLNGVTLKPLGRRGEVKTVHLTHDDLKNSAP
jgi:cytoskeleton protein RodZ